MRVSKSISMLSQAHRNSYNESQNHRVDSHSELSSNRVNNHIELSVQERERETGTEETVNSDVWNEYIILILRVGSCFEILDISQQEN